MVSHTENTSFLSDLETVAEALDRKIERARTGAVPVLSQRPLDAIVEDLQLDRFARHGGLRGDALRRFIDRYFDTIINLHQPGFDFLHRAVECTKSAMGLRF